MSTQPQSLPPHVQLIQLATAYRDSRLVFTAASLGIADHLAAGPRTSADVAKLTKTNPRALHRLLRALTNFGIVLQVDGGKFALGPLGEALKTGAPGSARSTILILAGQMMWRSFAEFQYSVETGKPAMDKVFGMPAFDYLAQHPDEAKLFSEAMVGIHGAEPPAVAAAYDFSKFKEVVDIGGATGNMLAHILDRYPEPYGVLFDRPFVVAEASALLRAKGVERRVRIDHGSFFESVPTGGDAYILSHIIHDWTEDKCLTILANCRKVMKPGVKLLVVESVLPEGNEPSFGKLLDMVMLAIAGGEERTASEYESLLARAGLKMTRVIPTKSDVSIVEAELS